MKRLFALSFLLTLLAAAVPAAACPACSGTTQNDSAPARWTFYTTTAGMISLPLAMVGGFALWLARRR